MFSGKVPLMGSKINCIKFFNLWLAHDNVQKQCSEISYTRLHVPEYFLLCLMHSRLWRFVDIGVYHFIDCIQSKIITVAIFGFKYLFNPSLEVLLTCVFLSSLSCFSSSFSPLFTMNFLINSWKCVAPFRPFMVPRNYAPLCCPHPSASMKKPILQWYTYKALSTTPRPSKKKPKKSVRNPIASMDLVSTDLVIRDQAQRRRLDKLSNKGPEPLLMRQLVYQQPTYLPGFPYLHSVEWGNSTGIGQGDLVFASRHGVFAVVETKHLKFGPGSKNTKKIEKVTEQVKRYRRLFELDNPGVLVIGCSCVNTEDGRLKISPLREIDDAILKKGREMSL